MCVDMVIFWILFWVGKEKDILGGSKRVWCFDSLIIDGLFLIDKVGGLLVDDFKGEFEFYNLLVVKY